MRLLDWIRPLPVLLALLLPIACGPEEPAVQDSVIDEGGVYQDGALEPVQPVEPEVAPTPDSAVIAPSR